MKPTEDFWACAGLALVILAIGFGFGVFSYLIDAGDNSKPCTCREQSK